MPSSPKIDQALTDLRRTIVADRMPHALLVSGRPRGSGSDFVRGLLCLLFPNTPPDQLDEHPDIYWVEPESKSRQIRVEEQIRPLIKFISLTAYSGGWKAGIVLFADRMNASSQNALLKTLEEPPPHSLLVLVTDIPAAMLPTIRSRAQYLDVLDERDAGQAPWQPLVMELLRNPPARRGADMVAWTDRLTAPLRTLGELASDEETARQEALMAARESDQMSKADKAVVDGRVASRVKEMREELLRTLQLWQRDVLACVQQAEAAPTWFPDDADAIAAQAQSLSFAEALRRVQAVDDVRELLEHNIRESVALLRLARAVSLPA
ncbi:MAG: hypothetical protein PHO14_07490 [Kiritimatiellae bacterium]|jgi:DNA polymerase-3 subunit delta'|nr:hypothetical protein [Kiritimatiellia bacterium]MDD4342062.1 hypothetical protein [Kiritimatiellia bacterium]MDY0148874.1 hypothetical protein [Kiritimatiellia bacterium]